MGFLRRVIDFLSRPSHSRTMGLVVMLILVVAVSLTVIAAQQQQQLKQRAAEITQECAAADSIPPCSSSNPANNTCDSEGTKCQIGNTIYECKKR